MVKKPQSKKKIEFVVDAIGKAVQKYVDKEIPGFRLAIIAYDEEEICGGLTILTNIPETSFDGILQSLLPESKSKDYFH